MSTFKLFGQELNYPESLDRYAEIMKERYTAMERERDAYTSEYRSCGDIETVLRTYESYAEKVFTNIEKELHNRLLNDFDLYDVSLDQFSKQYGPDYNALDTYYNKIAIQYDEIIATQENAKDARSYRKATRDRWEGGGFGLSGAIKGNMTAGTLNAMSGIGHSAINALGNGIDAIKASSKKSKLYENINSLVTLRDGLAIALGNLFYGFMNCVNEHYQKDYYEGISDEEKSKAYFDNAQAVADVSKKEMLLCNALQGNPRNSAIYKYILTNYGDSDGELEKMSCAFQNDFDIQKAKRDLIDVFLCKIDYTQKTEVETAKSELLKTCDHYHVDNSSYIESIDQIISEYSKAALFCDGFTYQTSEESDQARKERDQFIKNVGSINANNENALVQLKSNIENDYKSLAKDKYIAFLDKALKDYDQRYRTVRSKEYGSREEADIVKDEVKEVIGIKKNADFSSLQSIEDARKATAALDIHETVKSEYIEMYDECIKRWHETENLLAQKPESGRLDLNKWSYKAQLLSLECLYVGIKNSEFEEANKNLCNELLVVDDETFTDQAEANEVYYKKLFKAQSYRDNVANKDETVKKGFFAKALGSVKGAMAKGHESEYNYFSQNGTKEIPTDTKETRDQVKADDAEYGTLLSNTRLRTGGYKYADLDKKWEIAKAALDGNSIVEKDLNIDRDFIIDKMKACTEFANPVKLPYMTAKMENELTNDELADILGIHLDTNTDSASSNETVTDKTGTVDLILKDVGNNRVGTTMTMKEIFNLEVEEAVHLTKAPTIIKKNVPVPIADEIIARFKAVGAEVVKE